MPCYTGYLVLMFSAKLLLAFGFLANSQQLTAYNQQPFATKPKANYLQK